MGCGSEIFLCMLQECLSSQYMRKVLEGSCRKCLSLFITSFVTVMSVPVHGNVQIWGGLFWGACFCTWRRYRFEGSSVRDACPCVSRRLNGAGEKHALHKGYFWVNSPLTQLLPS